MPSRFAALWAEIRARGKVPQGNRRLVSTAGALGVAVMTFLAGRLLWDATITEWSITLIALFLLVYLAMVRSGEDNGRENDD